MTSMNSGKIYLILRFSSVGNVAMAVPIIEAACRLQPDDCFVVVSARRLEDLFYGIKNLSFLTADFTGKRSGYKGITKLYNEIRKSYKNIAAVIDLQNSFRTRALRWMFTLSGTKTFHIDNQIPQKRRMLFHGYEKQQPLRTEFERYEMVFDEARIKTDRDFCGIAINHDAQQHISQHIGVKTGRWIGIAPFAKSKTNMLPFRTTKELISRLSAEKDTHIFLFGAGEIECTMLAQWASLFDNTTSIAGSMPLSDELELMRQLDLMICMDSANQHLASLVGTRVVSIWCGTHPYIGFYGWKQSPYDCLQISVSCRPCTIHGRQYCKYYNYLCQQIKVEEILEKVKSKKGEK